MTFIATCAARGVATAWRPRGTACWPVKCPSNMLSIRSWRHGRHRRSRRLQRPGLLASGCLEQRLMLETVLCPGHGIETFRFDRTAVDGAFAVRPVVNPPKRITHLLEDHRVQLGVRKLEVDADVGHAGVAEVVR